MRKVFSLIFLFSFLTSFAQIDVAKFYCAESDMSAQDNRVKDQNGEVCALIKVETTQKGFVFDNGSLGIVKTDANHVGEIWVFVPPKTKRMTIQHPQLGTLRDYYFDVNIESGRVYIMQLVTGTVEHVVHQSSTQQYVLFKVTPPKESTVELNGEFLPVRDGTASKRLPFGTYTYRVEAPLYHSMAGQVEVNDPKNKHVVEIDLKPAYGYVSVPASGALSGASVYLDGQPVGTVPYKSGRVASGTHQVRLVKDMYSPVTKAVTVTDGETTTFAPTLDANFAELTLQVNGDAEIWVNNEKKGSGRWSGRLSSGGYEIECRKTNHRTTKREIDVTPDMDGQTISLETPRAIVGSVDIASSPGDAAVYVDGKKVGTSPMMIDELIIGSHEIKLTKPGYGDYVSTFTLTEGQTFTVDANLPDGREVTVTSDVSGATIYVDDVQKGVGTFTGSLGFGSHTAYAMNNGDKSQVVAFTVTQGSGLMGRVVVTFHEYVDLGLPSGTLWATKNVGAKSPEDYGSYFAWGETSTKSSYDWSTYKYCKGSDDSLTKYNTNSSCGTVDNKRELDLSDDAAYVNWGPEWRMPSENQFDELINSSYTTTEWTSLNGVEGRKIISKKNGKSIFLPAAGYRRGSSLYDAGSYGYYWSRALYSGSPSHAWYLYFDSGGICTNYGGHRGYGRSVRPVRR